MSPPVNVAANKFGLLIGKVTIYPYNILHDVFSLSFYVFISSAIRIYRCGGTRVGAFVVYQPLLLKEAAAENIQVIVIMGNHIDRVPALLYIYDHKHKYFLEACYLCWYIVGLQ